MFIHFHYQNNTFVFFSIFWWYMVYCIPNFLTHPNIIFLVVYPVKRSVGRWSGRSRSAGFPKLRTTMNMSTCLDQQKTKKHNTTYETVRRPLSHKICCPMLDAFYVFFYHGDLRSCGIMMDSVDRNAKNATAQWCLMIYFETESDYRHTFSQDQSQNGACRGNNFWFDILYRISKCCNPIIPSQHVTTIKNQHFPITHLEIAVRTVSTHSWLYLFFQTNIVENKDWTIFAMTVDLPQQSQSIESHQPPSIECPIFARLKPTISTTWRIITRISGE